MEVPVVKATEPSRSTRVALFVLNFLLVILIAAAAAEFVSTVVGVARGGDPLFGGRTLPVHAQLPRDQAKSLPPGVHLAHDPEIVLEVKDPSVKQLLLSRLAGVGPFVLLVGTLWWIRGLARSIKEGDPFSRANVQRLRNIGFLLAFGGLVVAVINETLVEALANTLPPTLNIGFSGGFVVPGNLLLAALGAFVLAEVFAYGVRLRKDVEATI